MKNEESGGRRAIKTFKLRQSGRRAACPALTIHTTTHGLSCSRLGRPAVGRMKAELDMPKGGYENIEKLKSALFGRGGLYIDGFYNTRRLHSSLNYLNPAAFEAQYYLQTG